MTTTVSTKAVHPDTEAFRMHYESTGSHWGNHSGGGSDPYHTIEYQAFLGRFLKMNGICSVVDIGCGDWQFSRFVNFEGVQYHGFDVVPGVVEHNLRRYGSASKRFDLMPASLADVPAADLLLMKDVLQHLPNARVAEFAASLFGRFRYCLLTNSYCKLDTPVNVDIPVGAFRCLDLTAAPFHLEGAYVLEFSSPLWERIRTLLVQRQRS